VTTPWELVKGLRIFDLARPLEAGTPNSPSNPPFRMALIRPHGDLVRADGASQANELFTIRGHTGTHIDGLAHVALNGSLFVAIPLKIVGATCSPIRPLAPA
jgi:kynurenine formamidase